VVEETRAQVRSLKQPARRLTMLKTLVYKRTHNGDPDRQGRFGAYDCMGSVRRWDYAAVIGVGGTGPEPRSWGIGERLNWIGIGPQRIGWRGRGPIVAFDHFRWFGRKGKPLARVAPTLAAHVYGRNVRSLMKFTAREASEVRLLLKLAGRAAPSPALARSGRTAAHGRATRPSGSAAAGAPSKSAAPVPRKRRC
jgi:hypothetical protein